MTATCISTNQGATLSLRRYFNIVLYCTVDNVVLWERYECSSKDVYKYSFFPQTIRDWNDLPESLISSYEMSDDSVSKFTSLVRARD